MQNLILKFIDYLGKEKGLADNTLESYSRDLRQYSIYLENGGTGSLETAERATIISYLMHLKKEGKAAATIARRLAALKSFYQFMVDREYMEADPTSNLESPKLEKRLP